MDKAPSRIRRFFVADCALAELALAAIVVLGMVTGIRREFEKGVAPLGAVIAVQGLGALTLALLSVGLRQCSSAWQGRPARCTRWLLVGTLSWVVWAFFRVVEYSS